MKVMFAITKKGSYHGVPFRNWKMKIKGLKPEAAEPELKPKCFPLSPKFWHVKLLLKSVIQNHLLETTCVGLLIKPTGCEAWGPQAPEIYGFDA